ncbi:unnamed protein product, partial [Musa hybrid cultivar]
LLRDGESSDSHGSYSSSLLSFHSDPRNSDSCAYNMLGAVISPPQESLSVVASQQSWACFDTSEKDCFEVGIGNKRRGQDRFGFIYSSAAAFDGLQESIGQTTNSCDVQSPKKQCGTPRRTKDKSTSPSKDPQQSIAAKNRRERISERLKILQDLVPNGTKVDLVTMLEKAISYVKFLQLQVKVLATDELWPGQGGKPPDVGQVKEAIDAILSSHGDSSNSRLRL